MWIVFLVSCVYADFVDLPKLNARINEVTISGFSSGAFMTAQMHYALSEYIHGAAIFAGIPYTCTDGIYERSIEACREGPVDISLKTLIDRTEQLSSQKLISDTNNLIASRVYIFSGLNDTTVLPEVVDYTNQ